jgi:hypothetical protein
MTFEKMRPDFIVRRKGSLSLPIAGAMLYSLAALLRQHAASAWN